jgi:formylglycine-generating enzyme required for sulfatase activity
VKARTCTPPHQYRSATRQRYYDDSAYANYPVVNVDWYQAWTFCQWEGKRLPTEAEWEKAARGSSDIRIFPWGNSPINCTMANYKSWTRGPCVGDTTEVGRYVADTSVYGVKDMTGNVWEWVADWYDRYYYQYSPYSNPTGPGWPSDYPDCRNCRVVRGGAWDWWDRYNRVSYRGRFPPEYYAYQDPLDPRLYRPHVGFRCVKR